MNGLKWFYFILLFEHHWYVTTKGFWGSVYSAYIDTAFVKMLGLFSSEAFSP